MRSFVSIFVGYNRFMFKRTSFWLGLLLGGLTSFGTRRGWLPLLREKAPDPLLDLVGDAVVVCNSSGVITYTNAAARTLFGQDGAGFSQLCYPSGQSVPPGQLPLARVQRTGKTVEGAGYLCVSPDGAPRVLDIIARPLPDGGTAATIRDMTALGEGQARETTTGRRGQVLRDLCRRLSVASDADELARCLVESALTLAEGLPQAHARLYLYDSEKKLLTRLASAPDDRPKRPKSQRQAELPTFPFDAASPLLWSVYIDRQQVVSGDVAGDARFQANLGEESVGSACALPLFAGGVALGHLSLSSRAAETFADEGLRDALTLVSSVAALALAGPRQAAQANHLGAQVEALRDVVLAVGRQTEIGPLADLVSRHVCRVVGGEVCLLALHAGAGLRLVGDSYKDALLFLDRHTPDDPALCDTGIQKTMRTGKTVQRVGLANPAFDAGVWRAFAGQSGKHSILAVPLAAGQGALTVFKAGDAPYSETHVKFVETLAALVSAALPSASPIAVPANR